MRISRKSAYSKLTNHIESLIASNVYTPGDKLPTRRELAVQFGLTSYAVQQGFEHLEAKGLVVLKHGSGVYVTTRRCNESKTGWNLLVYLHIANLNNSFLAHSLQGIQEEALKNQCSLTIRQRDYYGRHGQGHTLPVADEIEPHTQAVIFLGGYDFLDFVPPSTLPCCGIDIDDSYNGILSPVSLDPFAAAKLATDYFRARNIRHVQIHRLEHGALYENRAACFQHLWSKFGTHEEKLYLPWDLANQQELLPDNPQVGHFFTAGTWCDEKLKLWKAHFGTDAVQKLAIVSVDGKSLLVPGYEDVSTIGIDWRSAGRVAIQEILRRLEYPSAEARRIYLIPKLHEI